MITTALIKPIKRKKLAEIVAERLVSFIEQQYQEGQKLPSERELTEMLGVGRSSLREALLSLELMGVLETRNGAGTFVAGEQGTVLSKPLAWGVLNRGKSLKELVEARRLIEMAILELVIERISDEEIEALEVPVRQMESAKLTKQELFKEADLQFHLLLAQATKNAVLHETVNITRHILSKEQRRRSKTLEEMQYSASLHRSILSGLRKHNAPATRRAMRKHMEWMEVVFLESPRKRKSKKAKRRRVGSKGKG